MLDHFRLNLLSLANVRYIIATQPIHDARLKLIRAGRDAVVADGPDKTALRTQENFAGKHSLFLYENLEVLPRFFVASEATFHPDIESVLSATAATSTKELQRFVHLEDACRSEVPLGHGLKSICADVELLEYTPDTIDVSVTTDRPAILVGSNSYSPKWQCTINGQSQKVLPAYGAFWAVPVPTGKSCVHFIYPPPHHALFSLRANHRE